MSQLVRWFLMVVWAECGILDIAVGVVKSDFVVLAFGLNLLAAAAFMTVMDHEARGKGQ